MSTFGHAGNWRAFPLSLSTAGLAFLPKCPLCLATLLSAAGLSLPSSGPGLRTGRWIPATVGLAGALAAALGGAMVAGACLWNIIGSGRGPRACGDACRGSN